MAIPKAITKRDGSLVPFDKKKIAKAIFGASSHCGPFQMTLPQIERTVKAVLERLKEDEIPSVEQIQDYVEMALIDGGHGIPAKAYILYRAEHARKRNVKNALMQIYDDLTFTPAKNADMKRENANVNGDTSMGTMLKYGSEGSKYYCNNYILPPEIAEAHVSGDIHIHDEDFYTLTETCCQIDPLRLFAHGFSTGHGFLRPPKGILTRAALACIVIQANQNEMHGGQSIPNFDFAMAPGVMETFKKHMREAVRTWFLLKECPAFSWNQYEDEADAFAQKLFAMGHFVFCPEVVEEVAKWCRSCDIPSAPYMRAVEYAKPVAFKKTERDTYQAMEAVIHNLNTMNSRAGAQVPFSSLNYGTDTSPEGRMVTRQLLLATLAGLGAGETAIFPVQIFKMRTGVNYMPEDPNYDLFKLAMQVSAKRLFPNFSNLDAPFNAQYYKPGDYNSEVAYMGCRTRVMGNVYDPSREVTCGRGNLSFTSINLPRLALLSGQDPEAFMQRLDAMMDLVIQQLLHRLDIQSARTVRNYPFLMGEGVWLDSERLDWDDTIGEVLKHGTLSVGFIGLAEALKYIWGGHHGESEDARRFGYSVVKRMRDRLDKESKKRKLNFTLLATPAEGLSGRFVKLDLERFGNVAGVTDRKYYTNSFHVPVYYNISAAKKIEIEAPFHAMTNAGHITYVEIDGDPSKNMEAFESIVRYMHDQNVGYGSINFPLDRDPVCGYVGVIGDVCPRCGRRDGEAISVDKLKEIRRKYPPKCGCNCG